jgi:hypothetical protein
MTESRNSSVGIALGYELEDRGSRVRFPARAGNFSLHHRIQNASGAHPASYPIGTSSSFLGGIVAGAWSWPLPSSAEVKEWVEQYFHSPYTRPWHGAQLKHRDNLTCTFYIQWQHHKLSHGPSAVYSKVLELIFGGMTFIWNFITTNRLIHQL